MRFDKRLLAGAAVGLLVGLLGPVMGAVAGKSGSEPALATSAASVTARRGAWADWKVGRSTYGFYVWHHIYGEAAGDQATQDVERGSRGEAVAFIETCKPKKPCTRTTWRGPVTLGGTNAFAQAPDLAAAGFTGTLSNSAAKCDFRVVWKAGIPVSTAEERERSLNAAPQQGGASARAGASYERWSTATVESPCWSKPLGETNNARSWIDTDLTAAGGASS